MKCEATRETLTKTRRHIFTTHSEPTNYGYNSTLNNPENAMASTSRMNNSDGYHSGEPMAKKKRMTPRNDDSYSDIDNLLLSDDEDQDGESINRVDEPEMVAPEVEEGLEPTEDTNEIEPEEVTHDDIEDESMYNYVEVIQVLEESDDEEEL